MTKYRIKRRKTFLENIFKGAEYLCGFDFKSELDWRPKEGSYWSFFLIWGEDRLEQASSLAKEYGGDVVTIPAKEYSRLVEL